MVPIPHFQDKEVCPSSSKRVPVMPPMLRLVARLCLPTVCALRVTAAHEGPGAVDPPSWILRAAPSARARAVMVGSGGTGFIAGWGASDQHPRARAATAAAVEHRVMQQRRQQHRKVFAAAGVAAEAAAAAAAAVGATAVGLLGAA
eukprot:3447021-Alexandrium_andersonii.AAC.1